MRSILEEFANGNINPGTYFFKENSQYGRTLEALCDTEQQLLGMLDDTAKDLFKKFNDEQEELSLLSGIDRFINGYKLGVLMTMEVFSGKDALVEKSLENE